MDWSFDGVIKGSSTPLQYTLSHLGRECSEIGSGHAFMLQLKLMLGVIIASLAGAQELEPRAYSPSPVGTTFLGVAFGRSSGDISFDPAIPITNTKATLYFPALGVGQTFGLFGRQALITAILPYVRGSVSGDVGEQQQRITRSGLANLGLRFSVNLHGSPALTPAAFAAIPHRDIIVAASLAVVAPSGQYDKARLVNIGTNRWAFKPELGFSYPVKKFYLDFYAGSWFYADNASFFPGQSTRSQDPLIAFQAHVSYMVRQRFWLAFNSTWYGGGSVRVNGGPPMNRQSTSRMGGTLSLPVAKRQSLKIAYSSGVTGRVGAAFSTVTIGWQCVFFKRP